MFHPNGPSFFELARQAMSSTRQGYDLLAPKFDYTPFRTPAIILEAVQGYLETIGPIESSLDVCCGTGAGMEILAKVTSGRVAGIDFSQGMLDQAAENLSSIDAPTGGFEFIQGDILECELESEFDLAVCFGAFGHILRKDEDRFVQRISKALRPGGRFVFVTTRLPGWWTPTWWAARGFNAAMRVRNLIKRPPFIMYYLTFLWPDTQSILERHGMQAETKSPYRGPLKSLLLIDAIKQAA